MGGARLPAPGPRVPPPELRTMRSCRVSALVCGTLPQWPSSAHCHPHRRPGWQQELSTTPAETPAPQPRSLASRDHHCARRPRGLRTELETPHPVAPGGAVEEAGLVPASAGCHGNQGPATTAARRGEGLGPRLCQPADPGSQGHGNPTEGALPSSAPSQPLQWHQESPS